jgi:hypothetical protein
MMLPFNPPAPRDPFTLIQLNDWIALYRPASIELDDRQYSHLAGLMGFNPKAYRGIPIQFV